MRLCLAVLLALLIAAPAVAHPLDRWESKRDAPLPRQEAAFAQLDGKLYFAGGFEQGGAESARVDVYDIAENTWSVAAPMPEPAHHGAAVGLRGKLYFLGGLQTLAFAPTGRMWVYDPALGIWSRAPGLPPSRDRGAGAVSVHDGRILYVGGQRVVIDGAGPRRVASSAVDMYDPQTGTWTALPDMPTARDHFGVGIVGDTLYAVGGRQLRLDKPVAATEALDLEKRKWRTGDLAPIPTQRGGFATAVVDREIVTIGGESPLPLSPTPLHVQAHDDVEAYDPDKDRWRPMRRMETARYGIQGAVYGGGIWVAGGGLGMSVDASPALDVFFPRPRTAPPG